VTKAPVLQERHVCMEPESGRLGLPIRAVLWIARPVYQMRANPWSHVVISLDQQSAGSLVALLEDAHGASACTVEGAIRQHAVRVLGDRLTQTKDFYATRSKQDAQHDDMFPEYVVSFLFSHRVAAVFAYTLRLFVLTGRTYLLEPRKRLVFFLDRRSAMKLRDLLITDDARLRDEDFRDELIEDTREWIARHGG